jgi:hypothetical protein
MSGLASIDPADLRGPSVWSARPSGLPVRLVCHFPGGAVPRGSQATGCGSAPDPEAWQGRAGCRLGLSAAQTRELVHQPPYVSQPGVTNRRS